MLDGQDRRVAELAESAFERLVERSTGRQGDRGRKVGNPRVWIVGTRGQGTGDGKASGKGPEPAGIIKMGRVWSRIMDFNPDG